MTSTSISACADCGKRIQTRVGQEAAPVCHPCRRKRKGLPPGPQRPRSGPKAAGPRWRPQVITCHCGTTFTQRRAGQKYCCPAHRPPRKGSPGSPGRRAAARRRRLRVAATFDGVPDAEIFERDRWMCGICRKRIGKSFKYPHPRSASIDHLLPLSLGGDDTALNKRAAHLGCNMSRGNGRPAEQMPLPFGLDGGTELAPRPRRPRAARPRAPKPCLICGEPGFGTCELHMPAWFPQCDGCGKPFASRRYGKKRCEECREQDKRRRDRERMRQLRATQEGREHIEAIKWRHAAKQLGASGPVKYTDSEFDAVLNRLAAARRDRRAQAAQGGPWRIREH